jgi:hypothetical protein
LTNQNDDFTDVDPTSQTLVIKPTKKWESPPKLWDLTILLNPLVQRQSAMWMARWWDMKKCSSNNRLSYFAAYSNPAIQSCRWLWARTIIISSKSNKIKHPWS